MAHVANLKAVVSSLERMGVGMESISSPFGGSVRVLINPSDVGKFEGWSFRVDGEGRAVWGYLPPIDLDGGLVEVGVLLNFYDMEDAFGVKC